MATSRLRRLALTLALASSTALVSVSLIGAAHAQERRIAADAKLYRGLKSNDDPRDLWGVWDLRLRRAGISTTYQRLPPLTALGKQEYDRRQQAQKVGLPMADASTHCWPHGIPRLMNAPYPIKFVQSPGKITLMHEVGHNVRHIDMDVPMPKEVPTTFLGTTVGHWEGDTLVLETKGIDTRGWVDEDGLLHSDQMTVVERLRKVEGGTALENEITVTDPVFYTRPWIHRLVYDWAPDMRINEYICEENNRDRPENGVVTGAFR